MHLFCLAPVTVSGLSYLRPPHQPIAPELLYTWIVGASTFLLFYQHLYPSLVSNGISWYSQIRDGVILSILSTSSGFLLFSIEPINQSIKLLHVLLITWEGVRFTECTTNKRLNSAGSPWENLAGFHHNICNSSSLSQPQMVYSSQPDFKLSFSAPSTCHTVVCIALQCNTTTTYEMR